MDFLTITGIILALIAIAGGQYLEGGELEALLNGPALLIVLGGTIGAVMLQTPMPIFRRAFSIVPWIVKPPKSTSRIMAEKIFYWSKEVRKKGLLALENILEEEKHPIAQRGLAALITGSDAAVLRQILEAELDTKEYYDLQAARVFESMGGYSPTIGIIGAVLGLITVMRNLTDPSDLGNGIAVAFVATVYGVGLANVLFLPVANKLKAQVYLQTRTSEMVIEGLVSIAEGESSVILQDKLSGFLEEKHHA